VIECVFTLDYEIYGNGEGSLKELVYEPAEKLKTVFEKFRARMVIFVEAAELEVIEASGVDCAIDLVKSQLCEFRERGFELGLHLHPQWYNARREGGTWALDSGEYNLCALPPERINQIVGRSIGYIRKVLAEPSFSPLSFRAGNWLLQPTGDAARALAKHGIKIDSSVFKGGRQHQHHLDYRRSRRNGYYWPFSEEVNVPDPGGILLEIPTFTKMVPLWKMITAKRIGLQQKSPAKIQHRRTRLAYLRDFSRFRYPMKLDFCRLKAGELIRLLDRELKKDQGDPALFRPIVAIGHTKDLADLETIELFLSYLQGKGIPVSTFGDVHNKIMERDDRS
jgi:hypothetical protein